MGASRALRTRVEADARASDYWYVPKGKAASADNWPLIADFLRVLSKFRTVPWEEAQAKYVRALLGQKLIDPYKTYKEGFSAVGRMQLPVWRLLGLAWVNTANVPEVTEVGDLFIKSRKQQRRELLTMQLHRYQFWNPSAARHFSDFKTFPVLAFYRLLQYTDFHLSWEEFTLFGTRIRSFVDADDLADLVEEWRGLEGKAKEQVLGLAKTLQAERNTKSEEGTTWRKITDDMAYIQAMLSILPTIQMSGDGIQIPRAARSKVRRFVLEAASTAEVIEYRSEQDWLADYGMVPPKERWAKPWATAAEARRYYERVGKIDAATSAFAREQRGRTAKAIDEYRRVQVIERVLEDVLEQNLETLEEGLRLIRRQYPTAVGPIDILAEDAEGILVVIELKRGRSSDRVVGQIARYMAWVVDRLAKGKDARVRGIVVGREFDKHFEAAISRLRRVSPYTFDLRVLFEPWSKVESGRRGKGRQK
jgi:hypothetical protein